MADAIVAVGGTGKRCALLYLKLVNTLRPVGITTPGNNVFVVDMDPERGTPDDILNQQLIAQGVPNGNFISPVPAEARIDSAITLSRFMGFGHDGTRAISNTCFNDAQLNVQIIRGMNCEPTVGATVAARRFNPITNTDLEVEAFQTKLSPFSRIIVVGSIIGGTGAGVMPGLVKWINQSTPDKLIYGLLFLKWIDIPTGGIDEPNDIKIAGNTRAWLNYLIEHQDASENGRGQNLFHHYVLLGNPPGLPNNQPDAPGHHPLHLLGATYLLQFDQFLEKTPGSNGPHFIELSSPIDEDTIKMGEDSIAHAVIKEKLFAMMLEEFCRQQPDKALSPFTLYWPTSLSLKPFIVTMEKQASRWRRYGELSGDWNLICRIFEEQKRNAEDRIQELQDLTDNLPGAADIFHFNWIGLTGRAEKLHTDASRAVARNLVEQSEVYGSHDAALKGIAEGFINQLRGILRGLTIR